MSDHPTPSRTSFLHHASAVSIATTAVLFTQIVPNAAASEYIWTQTAGGTQNWTDGTNWDGGSAPSPVSGDTVDFSTVDLLDNTTLNLGANRTATTWRFGDTDGGQTWTVSGNTLFLAGSGAGIEVGTATTISSIFSVTNGTTATATGNGALTLDTSNFSLGGTTTDTSQILDLTGLAGGFTYNNSSGTFRVSGTSTSTSGNSTGTIYLAPTSEITASVFGVGTSSGNANSGTAPQLNFGTVYLGSTDTTINTDTITLGAGKSQGTVQYAAEGGATNPELTLRGSDGTSRVTTMIIGTHDKDANNTTNTWNLTSHVSGTSQIDAMIDTLTIGESSRTSGNATSASVTGNFLMGGGTLDATTIVLGRTVTNTRMLNTTGTFTTGAGGTVKVGTLTIGDKNATENKTVTATFNLDGGADLHATTIQAGNTAANGTVNRNFNWNDGTIHNLTDTDLTIGADVTWTLAATGTHAFDIENGRTGTVDAVMAGAGALTKSGAGTLKLAADNTYTGATLVAGGTLVLDGANTGGGALTVAANARLGGSGSTSSGVTLEDQGKLLANISDWSAGTADNMTVGSLTLSGAWSLDVNIDAFTEDDKEIQFLTTGGISGFVSPTSINGPGEGTWSVRTNTLDPNILELVYTSGSTYDAWAASYDLVGGPDDDDDGDGLTNFEEFAFGLDPTSGASVNPITDISELSDGIFSYTRTADSGLIYTYWISTDLQDWGTEPAAVLLEEAGNADGNGVQTVDVAIVLPEEIDKLFLRVQAAPPAAN